MADLVQPTPAQPWVVRDDGTVDVYVWQGRTWRAAITHPGLTDPTGYKVRVGFKATFAGDVLASGSTEDGAITLEALPAGAGTLITVAVPDEAMEAVNVSKGKWDAVIENPSGEEDALFVGAFVCRLEVTP